MAKFSIKNLINRLFSGEETDFRGWFWRQVERGHSINLVFTPNPEQVVLASESEEFLDCLLSGDILLADGVGLVWASRLKGKPVARITGADTLRWWLEEARQKQVRTLLLGGRGGVAELVAKKYDPEGEWCWGMEGHVNIAAAQNPQFKDQIAAEEKEIFDVIQEKKPKVIFVAFGAPWQEEFLCRQKEEFSKLGVRIGMVCGGSFDYLAGFVPRAPKFIRTVGMEWLYRLITEPWRWRRQLNLVKFIKVALG